MCFFCTKLGLLRVIFTTFAMILSDILTFCLYETEAIYILVLSGGDGDAVGGMSTG